MPSPMEVWPDVVRDLSRRFSKRQVSTWLGPVEPRAAEAGVLRLAVPNHFHGEWLGKRYAEILLNHVEEHTGERPKLRLEVDPSLLREAQEAAEARRSPRSTRPRVEERTPTRQRNPFPLNAEHLYENWVSGPSNDFATAATRAVVARQHEFRTVVLQGDVASGKTHLAQAMVQELEESDPDRRVLYATGEQFLNTFIQAAENGELHAFRERFRGVEVLVLDDVQTLAGKEKSQREFEQTLKQLIDSGAWVVVTIDRPPAEVEGLSERLRSCLSQGLRCPLGGLTPSMRREVVQRRAREEQAPFPPEVAEWIAESVRGNVRELIGAATCVLGHATLMQRPVSLELARSVLHDLAPPRTRTVSFEAVAEVVSAHYGVSVEEMQGKRRTQRIVRPRQVAMGLCRRLSGASLESIGRFFGGRDHSTVLYSIDQVDKRARRDPQERAHLEALTEQVLNRP